MAKNPPANNGRLGVSLGPEDPLKQEMVTYSSVLSGRCYGQRSLVGYHPWGHKEWDRTEGLK